MFLTRQNDRGSALIAFMILGVLMSGLALWFCNWTWVQNRGTVHAIGGENALQYAQSGVNAAQIFLQQPNWASSLQPGMSFTVNSATATDGGYAVSLYRNTTSYDTSLIQGYATGYFYIGNGSVQINGQAAQQAVIEVKYKIQNTSEYLLSMQNSLTIDGGSDWSGGSIYALGLTFSSTGTINMGPAYYYASVFPSASPPNVTPNTFVAQKLPYALNFPYLNSSIRATYQANASGNPNPAFSGMVGPDPLSNHVYFANGDVVIGQTAPLTVSGVYVIYSTGNVYIENNIVLADTNSWVAILAEGGVYLQTVFPGSTWVGPTLTVNGTFMTNQNFWANGSQVPGGILNFTGSIECLLMFNTERAWPTRQYTYFASSNPNLLLPNYTQVVEFNILQGKYLH